jgi:hypothetical protein
VAATHSRWPGRLASSAAREKGRASAATRSRGSGRRRGRDPEVLGVGGDAIQRFRASAETGTRGYIGYRRRRRREPEESGVGGDGDASERCQASAARERIGLLGDIWKQGRAVRPVGLSEPAQGFQVGTKTEWKRTELFK